MSVKVVRVRMKERAWMKSIGTIAHVHLALKVICVK